jgi:hypothetical protein
LAEQLPALQTLDKRNAACETLKALLRLGCRIEPARSDPPRDATPLSLDDEKVLALSHVIENPEVDLALLLAAWRERDEELWPQAPQLYRQLGERLLKLGVPMLANEVVREGLEHAPQELRLRQLRGLALARSGYTEQAHGALRALADEGHADEESLGLLGRTSKDLGLLAADPMERDQYLREAYQTYFWAYREYHSYWTGINAATLALLLGQSDRAHELARNLQAQCRAELDSPKPSSDRYWLLATLGEAALLLGEWAEAEDWYTQAGAAGCQRLGDLNSTRRQARLLLERLGRDPAWIDRVLRYPRVVVFTGHMVDRPGRARPRFPAVLEPAVAQAVRDRLRQVESRVGYASAACGSDLLFLEAVQELGGETHVVLPYDKDLFARDSVAIIPGANWDERYEQVLKRAAQVVTVSSQKMAGGGVSYDYANLVLHGLSSVRAGELQTELVALAVWDGKRGDGPGGTATTVERWRQLGVRVELIELDALLRQNAHSWRPR